MRTSNKFAKNEFVDNSSDALVLDKIEMPQSNSDKKTKNSEERSSDIYYQFKSEPGVSKKPTKGQELINIAQKKNSLGIVKR